MNLLPAMIKKAQLTWISYRTCRLASGEAPGKFSGNIFFLIRDLITFFPGNSS